MLKTRICVEDNKECMNIINSIDDILKFIDDFKFLLFGRDIIMCDKYIFSLQNLLNSSLMTLENIKTCCVKFTLADAYTLLRKYRDDLFFCLYLISFDSMQKIGDTKKAEYMKEKILKWCNNNLTGLYIGDILTAIYKSDIQVSVAIKRFKLKEAFDSIATRLNNYVHGNGWIFYNSNIISYDEDAVRKELEDITRDIKYVSIVFIFLLILCSPGYVMATDYIDYLEANEVPPENSQYWVPPFVKDFLCDNLNMIHNECYEFLKNNTCMFL